MAVMKGAPVAAAIKARLAPRVAALAEMGITPTLLIIRVGRREDDLAYERGVRKRFEGINLAVRVEECAPEQGQAGLMAILQNANKDDSVHGILVFCPLPKGFDEQQVKAAICPEKDMDGMHALNVASVFAGVDGYAPCTAEAVMAVLEHYAVPIEGKRVVILGRSMVVGRPLAMLMLHKHGTVTICHTRTRDLAAVCRQGDILVAAVGKAEVVNEEMVRAGAIVVDVGINMTTEGEMVGDVDYAAVAPKCDMITPVPGGVGTVTTSILAAHVVRAAERKGSVQ